MNESTTGLWGMPVDSTAMRRLRLVDWLDVWWDGVFATMETDWLTNHVRGSEAGIFEGIEAWRGHYKLDAETAYMAALFELEARR